MLLLVNENFPYTWQHTEHDQLRCSFCLFATYKPLHVFKCEHEGTISKSKIEVPVGFIALLGVSSNLPKPQVETSVQQKLGNGHKMFSCGV